MDWFIGSLVRSRTRTEYLKGAVSFTKQHYSPTFSTMYYNTPCKFQQVIRLALRSFQADEARYISCEECGSNWILTKLSSKDEVHREEIDNVGRSLPVPTKSFYVLDRFEESSGLLHSPAVENCLRGAANVEAVRFLAASKVFVDGVAKGFLCIYGYQPRQHFSIRETELLEEIAATLSDSLYPTFEGDDIVEDHTKIAFGVFSQLQEPLKRVSNALSQLESGFNQLQLSPQQVKAFETELSILNQVMDHTLAVALIAVDSVKDTKQLVTQSLKDFQAYIQRSVNELSQAFHMQPPSFRIVALKFDSICHLPAATWLSLYSTFRTASQHGCTHVDVDLKLHNDRARTLRQQCSLEDIVVTMVDEDDEDDYPVSYSPCFGMNTLAMNLVFANPKIAQLQESTEPDWRHLVPTLVQEVAGVKVIPPSCTDEYSLTFTITMPFVSKRDELCKSRSFMMNGRTNLLSTIPLLKQFSAHSNDGEERGSEEQITSLAEIGSPRTFSRTDRRSNA